MSKHTQHKHLSLLSNFTQGQMGLFPSLPLAFVNPCFYPHCRCAVTNRAAPAAPQQILHFTSLTEVA